MFTPNQCVSNFANDKNIIICRFSQLFLKNISFENKEEQNIIAAIYVHFFSISVCVNYFNKTPLVVLKGLQE